MFPNEFYAWKDNVVMKTVIIKSIFYRIIILKSKPAGFWKVQNHTVIGCNKFYYP